ncbi:hypothetical protein D3C72_585080 [compost metagenome]
MSVDLADERLAGAGETGDLPGRNAILKQPGDAGVLQRVRRYVRAEPRPLSRAFEAPPLTLDDVALVLAGAIDRQPSPPPNDAPCRGRS